MIYWAPFLHFYQPPIQFHSILKKICNESYRPLLKVFQGHPSYKVTINMNGVLTEMLNEHGAGDITTGLKNLANNKQIEFVDSAKFHAILPLIPKKEIIRQVKLNRKTNETYFKEAYKPTGFFLPEMCYSNDAAKVLRAMGYEWLLASGIACQHTWPMDFIANASLEPSSIKVLYRDDILSNKISFRNLNSVEFIQEIVKLGEGSKDAYFVTAMDAETFGHHIHDWEKLFLAGVYETIDTLEQIHHHYNGVKKKDLAEIHKKIFMDLKELPHIEVVTISELLKKFPMKKSKPPRPSSWSTSKEDMAAKNYYPLWKTPGNPVHQLQWEHVSLCQNLVTHAFRVRGHNKESNYYAMIARTVFDKALHSCQFWWANKNRGLWSVNMINKGLMLQEEAALNADKAINLSTLSAATKQNLYHKFMAARGIADKIRDLLIQ